MAKKGIRKSKKAKMLALMQVTKESYEGPEKPEVVEQPSAGVKAMSKKVNLRAKIHDVGMLTITVSEAMVDETLEKIWLTGFKQKLNNRQRTHQVYGPHLIDRIDVEPII